MADDKHTVIDTSEVSRNLQRLAAKLPGAEDKLLGQVLQAGVKLAQDRTPVLTGALKAANAAKWHGGEEAPGASGHPEAEMPRPFPAEAKAGEGYLYNSMSYAAAVHEDMDAHHDVGEAKFIEKVLPELGGEMMERIAADLMDELRKALR